MGVSARGKEGTSKVERKPTTTAIYGKHLLLLLLLLLPLLLYLVLLLLLIL